MKFSDLYEWCTVRDLEVLQAIEKHGSQRRAAQALGVAHSLPSQVVNRVRRKAAAAGYSPEHHLTHRVAPGFAAKGHSTLFRRGEPEPVLQWVKTTRDTAAQEQVIREAVQALCDDIPRVDAEAVPAAQDADLCTVYTLTDCHVGAACWGHETGGDWDLPLAEATLVGCFARLLAASPPSAVGVVAQLGDFLHADGITPVTPTHGHVLDASGRFTQAVRVAVRVLRSVIGQALRKHTRVVVLLAEGNHDISSSIWLRTMFAALFEREPRVTVIDHPLPYYVHQHGQVMLAWHHGHLKKMDDLPLLFAAEFPTVWGATTKRYCHTGHRHHSAEREHGGMTVTQHPTLAARDAYAARGGWHAERQATAITYHAGTGRHSSVTVTPE